MCVGRPEQTAVVSKRWTRWGAVLVAAQLLCGYAVARQGASDEAATPAEARADQAQPTSAPAPTKRRAAARSKPSTARETAASSSPSDTRSDATSVPGAEDVIAADTSATDDTAGDESQEELTSLDDVQDIQELSLEDLLDQTVVTASGGREESAAIAGATMTVFTAQEIRSRGWRSLLDMLRNTPGLYIIDDHVMPSVAVRGVSGGLRAGSRVVKIMINGVPVSFRPDLTAFLGPEFLPIEAIERVEIAKGPLSAVYGANAFLATVNVITRTPGSGTTGRVVARGGLVQSHPGHQLGATLSYGTERLNMLFAVSAARVDRSGLSVSRTFKQQNPDSDTYGRFFEQASQNDLTQPNSQYLGVNLDFEDYGKLRLQAGRQVLDAMGEFQIGSVLTHRSRIALENDWTNARYQFRFNDDVGAWITGGWSGGRPTQDEELYTTGDVSQTFTRHFQYDAYRSEPGRRRQAVRAVAAEGQRGRRVREPRRAALRPPLQLGFRLVPGRRRARADC